MNKQMLNLIIDTVRIRWIRFFVIPILLFILGIIFSLLFIQRQSLSAIHEAYVRNNYNIFPEGRLTKDQKIKAQFKASYNNLGIISVHMETNTNDLETTDRLVFRIREKGKNSWYYENTYDSNLFNKLEYSPFGFPIIADSKGKTYEFEILSLSGNMYNAVVIKKHEPIFMATYKFTGKEMLSDNNLWFPVFNNMRSVFLNATYLSYSSIFFLPFLFYVLYIIATPPLRNAFLSAFSFGFPLLKVNLLRVKKFARLRDYLFTVLIIITLFDIFLLKIEFHGIFLGFFALWIFFDIKYKLRTKHLIIISIILFLISLISVSLGFKLQVVKSSIWFYAFLWIILVHYLLNEKK